MSSRDARMPHLLSHFNSYLTSALKIHPTFSHIVESLESLRSEQCIIISKVLMLYSFYYQVMHAITWISDITVIYTICQAIAENVPMPIDITYMYVMKVNFLQEIWVTGCDMLTSTISSNKLFLEMLATYILQKQLIKSLSTARMKTVDLIKKYIPVWCATCQTRPDVIVWSP